MKDLPEELRKFLESKSITPDQMSEVTKQKIFAEKLITVLECEPDKRREKMKEVDNKHKLQMFEAMVNLIDDHHLHEAFAGFISRSNNCSGMTRFAFVMAHTQEDWEKQMKKLNEEQHKEPILQTEKQFEHRIKLKAKDMSFDKVDSFVESHKINID